MGDFAGQLVSGVCLAIPISFNHHVRLVRSLAVGVNFAIAVGGRLIVRQGRHAVQAPGLHTARLSGRTASVQMQLALNIAAGWNP
jgi:hypothetical protein